MAEALSWESEKAPSLEYLTAAFLAMEPSNCFVSLARQCGGGSITAQVQTFILENCISNVGKGIQCNSTYVKNILKKVIAAAESTCDDIVDGLFEQFGYYMTLPEEDDMLKEENKIQKKISFLYPNGSTSLIVPLQCSLNMLEGDTGCSIWPSSLFLSELILSNPMIFSNKFCFEVGSGVGLVGISLSHVGASKVVLTDGDISSLANMKHNLKLNCLASETKASQRKRTSLNMVECKHLPWESYTESEIQSCQPDIVLAADVIYNPICLPYLIQVLSILLKTRKYRSAKMNTTDTNKSDVYHHGENHDDNILNSEVTESPTAYIAQVIRNYETFNYFLELAEEADLSVVDITETKRPQNLLPYMLSYERSSIRLFRVSFS